MSYSAVKLLLHLNLLFCTNWAASIPFAIDSDSPNYEQMYDTLVAEYIEGLTKTTEKPEINLAAAVWSKADYDAEREQERLKELADQPKPELVEKIIAKESYEEKTRRLKCDNPWFWNTFKCTWLDYWNWEPSNAKRYNRNAKVAGILGGILLVIIMIPCCSCCVVICYAVYAAKKMRKTAEKYTEKITPGIIVLPDGTKHEYEATVEEQEALMDLLQEMTTLA